MNNICGAGWVAILTFSADESRKVMLLSEGHHGGLALVPEQQLLAGARYFYPLHRLASATDCFMMLWWYILDQHTMPREQLETF